MMENIKERLRSERGQIGIETLVIFIAMILVAAIAAGILINTAGFLQNKASETSEDSTEQVSNQVQVLTATGDVHTSGDNVTTLDFTIMPSPGADEIDLSSATIEYIGPEGKTTLVHGSTADDTNFSTTGLKGSAPVLTNKSDRFQVTIDLESSYEVAQRPLVGGDSATVKFVTQSGGTYTYIVNVPESLNSNAGGTVSV